MLYFDYSATTFPSKEVLKAFDKAATTYVGNPNSSHALGVRAKKRIDEATSNITRMLNIENSEIIYTSGSSEANNLAIKGVCALNKGKHVITTNLEHSSVVAPINRLANEGYEVSIVNLNSDGTVDLEDLKSKMREDTILVSIVGVNSELGIKQNIDEIGTLLLNYPNCYYHVDATQMIGKTDFDFSKADLVTFSAHKFYGIKGIGCLVKKNNVKLMPQIDGGSSTTKFRSGTPTLELIVSLEIALRDALIKCEESKNYVNKISNEIKEFLTNYSDIKLNNTEKSIPQIINFSIPNSRKLVDMLNECGVYLSTKSACSLDDAISKPVMMLYNDEKRAGNSVRISISYKTTPKEIANFKKIFSVCYNELRVYDENN